MSETNEAGLNRPPMILQRFWKKAFRRCALEGRCARSGDRY